MPSTNELKYGTANPIARRLIGRFLDRVVELVAARAPRRIVDLGCGEGFVAAALHERLSFPFDYRGLEIDPQAAAAARSRVPGCVIDVGDLLTVEPLPGWADLALSLEVLEHLADPRTAVERVRAWTARDAIVSVPWEPFFRIGNLLRGKHLRRFGNHPEHLQQFAPASLHALLSSRFAQVRIVPCFPWLIAVARCE